MKIGEDCFCLIISYFFLDICVCNLLQNILLLSILANNYVPTNVHSIIPIVLLYEIYENLKSQYVHFKHNYFWLFRFINIGMSKLSYRF